MDPTMAAVITLPRAASDQLASYARRSPAFQPIIDRLPAEPGPYRLRCEQLLSQLLRRALYSPRLTAAQAAEVLDHPSSVDDVTEEELARLASDPTTCRVHDLWSEVWADEDDIRVRGQVRYYAALLARLYRLEYQVRAEATAT